MVIMKMFIEQKALIVQRCILVFICKKKLFPLGEEYRLDTTLKGVGKWLIKDEQALLNNFPKLTGAYKDYVYFFKTETYYHKAIVFYEMDTNQV